MAFATGSMSFGGTEVRCKDGVPGPSMLPGGVGRLAGRLGGAGLTRGGDGSRLRWRHLAAAGCVDAAGWPVAVVGSCSTKKELGV